MISPRMHFSPLFTRNFTCNQWKLPGKSLHNQENGTFPQKQKFWH